MNENSSINSTEYPKSTLIPNITIQNLEDLKSIGLLTYLLSLPSDRQIKKTSLYSQFGKAAVNSAFKELIEKRYLFIVKVREGQLNNFEYFVADSPYTDEQIKDIINKIKKPIIEVTVHNFNIDLP